MVITAGRLRKAPETPIFTFLSTFLTRESPLMTNFHFSFLHLRPVVKSYHLRCRTKNFTIKQKYFQKWSIFVAGHAKRRFHYSKLPDVRARIELLGRIIAAIAHVGKLFCFLFLVLATGVSSTT